jgi:hypothetical protein
VVDFTFSLRSKFHSFIICCGTQPEPYKTNIFFIVLPNHDIHSICAYHILSGVHVALPLASPMILCGMEDYGYFVKLAC